MMIEQIYKANAGFYIVAAICGVSVLVRIALVLLFRRLVKEASSPNKRKSAGYSRRFISCIMDKYVYEYEKSYSVNNVSVFVDKYMYDIKMLGIRSFTWETLEVVSVIMCLAVGTLNAFGAYYLNAGQSELIKCVLDGLLASGIIIISDTLFDLSGRRTHLHTIICDYLENYMKPRLERGEYNSHVIENVKLLDEIDEGMLELIDSMENMKNMQDNTESEKNGVEQVIENEDEKIIEDVIREYLT